MNQHHTPEEMFNFGAEAMRSRLVSLTMMLGHAALATRLLTEDLPRFELPEVVRIGGTNDEP